MAVCKKCNAEYKEGEKFCSQCGTLLPSEEPHSSMNEQTDERIGGEVNNEEVPVKKRFVCPRCKIIYERGDACIRCGAPVVEQTSSAKGEELPSSSTHETEKEEPSLSSAPPVPEAEREDLKTTRTQEVKKEPLQKQTPLQRSLNQLTRDRMRDVSSSRKKDKKFLRLSREAVSVFILIGTAGYFLWCVYSYFIVKRPEASTPPSQGVSAPVPTNAPATVDSAAPAKESKEIKNRQAVGSPSISQEVTPTVPQTASSSPPSPVTDLPEVENIKNLLKNIQQGNLRKDIGLFMSCYSPAFKGREGKRKETLENWENFNYLDLSYALKSHSVSGNTAHARIEWRITFTPKAGGRTQENQTVMDVTFKREEDGWKITEVKPAG